MVVALAPEGIQLTEVPGSGYVIAWHEGGYALFVADQAEAVLHCTYRAFETIWCGDGGNRLVMDRATLAYVRVDMTPVVAGDLGTADAGLIETGTCRLDDTWAQP